MSLMSMKVEVASWVMKGNERGVLSGGMNGKGGERSSFIGLGVEMSYG